MKKIYRYLLLTMLASGSLFYSCETTELELLTSPNSLSPADIDVDLVLNRIQMEYLFSMASFNNTGADLGRVDYMFGRNYFNNYGSGTVQGAWNNLYNDMIPDIAAIEALNSPDNDLSWHLGTSKLMQAHVMMMLVDFLGDIVWSEANNPTEFPTPNLDDDASVYTAAIALIDEGLAYLNGASAGTATDLYYGGDASKWIKLGNTLKMRADLTTGNYAGVLAATNVMSSSADDLQFSYGTNELSPDNRHPDYAADYRSDGANIYMSNWLMDLMVGQYGDLTDAFAGEGITDPRRRYYWVRQNWRTPGSYALYEDVNGLFGPAGTIYLSNGAANAEVLECSGLITPSHLEFTPDESIWCAVKLGYWGRTHGNDEGTPPDNFLRTASGVYPAGGLFDGRADAFPYVGESISGTFGQKVGLGKGGGGAGIEPIILASSVEFWRAEANLMLGNDAAAATNMENAMAMHIAKVQSFGALDSGADFSQAPDAAVVADFVSRMKTAFENAPASSALDGNGYPVEKAKMDILGEQFFVAMYGGAADCFNFIRRTGYPRTLARNIEPNAGAGTFPRTVLYPGNEVQANPNIIQRTDLNAQVFWDSGTTNPAN